MTGIELPEDPRREYRVREMLTVIDMVMLDVPGTIEDVQSGGLSPEPTAAGIVKSWIRWMEQQDDTTYAERKVFSEVPISEIAETVKPRPEMMAVLQDRHPHSTADARYNAAQALQCIADLDCMAAE